MVSLKPLHVTALGFDMGSWLLDCRLEGVLGRGGISVVYLAKDLSRL
jgi:hypothetical protein